MITTMNTSSNSLNGKTVAILATDGFEQTELFTPRDALTKAGATVKIVSLQSGEIQGFDHLNPDRKVKVDMVLKDAKASDFDALVLPGGVSNPDALRIEQPVLDFVRDFAQANKPIGAICHAPWILIDAGLVKGRNLTSYPSIRTDLKNAGAEVLDQEVVVDNRLVTSRNPDDLPAFCRKLIELIGEGASSGQSGAKAVASERQTVSA